MRCLISVVLGLWAVGAMAQELPVPPSFTPEADAEEVLREYPLGVITAVAAHSHHGHADHRIDLPNGLLGWV